MRYIDLDSLRPVGEPEVDAQRQEVLTDYIFARIREDRFFSTEEQKRAMGVLAKHTDPDSEARRQEVFETIAFRSPAGLVVKEAAIGFINDPARLTEAAQHPSFSLSGAAKDRLQELQPAAPSGVPRRVGTLRPIW